MFVFYLIATKDLHSALVAVLSGGLLFGAVFMATDYVTSPFTLKGKLCLLYTSSKEKHESLKEYFLAMVQGRLQYDEFYALKDVSLDLSLIHI